MLRGVLGNDVAARSRRAWHWGRSASFALSKWLESLLYGTTPTNPAVFSGVALLLCAIALAAAYLPARRASRIEPLQALRTE